MNNAEIAARLDELADLLEIEGDEGFRVRAYRAAARAVAELPAPAAQADLSDLGASSAARVRELLATGSFRDLDDARGRVPAGLREVLSLPGIGPKTTGALWRELGVDSVDALEAAARGGRLKQVPRMKSADRVLEAIATWRRLSAQIRLSRALAAADAVAALLPGARIAVTGAARRREATVTVLELLAEGDTSPLGEGPEWSFRVGAVPVRLRAVPALGGALLATTGNRLHTLALRRRAKARGVALDDQGAVRGGAVLDADEDALFRLLDLDPIPPELREGLGEIELAARHALPRLLEIGDLRGDLHMHTRETDGAGTARDMAEAAAAVGHDYIAITDHSKSTSIANGMDEARLAAQLAALRAETFPVRVLCGVEVDVLPDGALDLAPELLADLDWVVASVHGQFHLGEQAMTERVVRAIASGLVDVVGHPTGRQLGARDGYPLDFDRVFEAALAHDVALEINGSPGRMDLDGAVARRAREAGVRLVVSTDSHHPGNLATREFGVWTARRAWAGPEHVVNTAPAAEIVERRRARLARRA